MGAEFKVRRILAPLAKSLRSHGVLLGIQSMGHDPGQEIVERIWPDESPFPVDRHRLLKELHDELGDEVRHFDLFRLSDAEEAYELGIEEAFADAVTLIEWPERIAGLLPAERLDLTFAQGASEEARALEWSAHGEAGRRLAAALGGP